MQGAVWKSIDPGYRAAERTYQRAGPVNGAVDTGSATRNFHRHAQLGSHYHARTGRISHERSREAGLMATLAPLLSSCEFKIQNFTRLPTMLFLRHTCTGDTARIKIAVSSVAH